MPPLGIFVLPSRSRALLWCLHNFICSWIWYQFSLFSCAWAYDESMSLLPWYLSLIYLLFQSFVIQNNCFIFPHIECSPSWTDLLSCLTVLDLFPSRRRLAQGQIWVSINIFRKPIKLYFETLLLAPLLHCLLLLRFFMRIYCIQLSLINLSFLVTSGPWLWDCLIALFHHFRSVQLPPAESGGISEQRLKTPWLLPYACFLLWVLGLVFFLTSTSVLAFLSYLFGRGFKPLFLKESFILPLLLHLSFSKLCSFLSSPSEWGHQSQLNKLLGFKLSWWGFSFFLADALHVLVQCGCHKEHDLQKWSKHPWRYLKDM